MEKHNELSDIEFEKKFNHRSLDPSLFTHEAHLRLAWIHIQKYGIEVALDNVYNQIKAFVEHVGAAEKFNATLTIAAVKVMHHFINKANATSFSGFLIKYPRLKTSFKELMEAHYSKDIFTLPDAKVRYLEPDLIQFDC